MNKTTVILIVFIVWFAFVCVYIANGTKKQQIKEIGYTIEPGFNCVPDPETGKIICSLISPFDMTVEAWKERNSN